jgi:hypothetical protein
MAGVQLLAPGSQSANEFNLLTLARLLVATARSEDKSTAPLSVIPEGAGTVNPYEEDPLGVVCPFPPYRRAAVSPPTGSTVERPQRSENVRPWGRQGLTQDRRGGGTVAWVDGLLQVGC